jgi:hypothetical protein
MIRHLVTRDHAVRDVLTAPSLDPACGPLARRLRIQNEAHHHRRLVRSAAVTVGSVRRVERLQIKPTDRIDHEPRKMVLRQPIPQRRRHQESLLTITIDEVLRHAGIPPRRPDRTPLCDSHHAQRDFSNQPMLPECCLGLTAAAIRSSGGSPTAAQHVAAANRSEHQRRACVELSDKMRGLRIRDGPVGVCGTAWDRGSRRATRRT